jgi:nucleotide-binding universal stress UspA family protein
VAFDIDSVRERHREEALAKLSESVPSEVRARTKLETAVLESGGVYKEILRAAEREESDLIVMGIMGRSAADMFFFGSTTNHVVRAARCPVLTVRWPEKAEG